MQQGETLAPERIFGEVFKIRIPQYHWLKMVIALTS